MNKLISIAFCFFCIILTGCNAKQQPAVHTETSPSAEIAPLPTQIGESADTIESDLEDIDAIVEDVMNDIDLFVDEVIEGAPDDSVLN